MVPSDELEGFDAASRWRKHLWMALAGIAAVSVIVYAAVKPAEQQEQRLPDFELRLLSGEGSLSRDDLLGQPIVLNFWASWCDPCREETPLLERTYQAYRDQGVQFVGVNVRDSARDARDFIDDFGVTYPVVSDPDQVLAGALNVTSGLPQTFFIDRNGVVASASVEGSQPNSSPTGLGARAGGGGTLGALSKEQLEQGVEQLLQPARDDG